MINKKTLWIFIIILIAVEQGIKLVINMFYFGSNFPIISPWVYFDPMFNRDYSWFNSMLQLNMGRWIHVIFVAILIIFLYLFYKFIESSMEADKVTDTAFAFIFSGALCSLIDKVFWNGSLDYILIQGFFTFDLKDVYINIFNAMLVLMIIFDYKGLRRIDESQVMRAFVKFLKLR